MESLKALNSDLATNVPGLPVFETILGMPSNVSGPTLAVDYKSDLPPKRAATGEKLVGLSFQVMCLLPSAGSNSPDDFAVCKARARDFITTLFDEDINSLTPRIDAGLIGIVSALEGARGGITDLYGMETEDKVTRVRGSADNVLGLVQSQDGLNGLKGKHYGRHIAGKSKQPDYLARAAGTFGLMGGMTPDIARRMVMDRVGVPQDDPLREGSRTPTRATSGRIPTFCRTRSRLMLQRKTANRAGLSRRDCRHANGKSEHAGSSIGYPSGSHQ